MQRKMLVPLYLLHVNSDVIQLTVLFGYRGRLCSLVCSIWSGCCSHGPWDGLARASLPWWILVNRGAFSCVWSWLNGKVFCPQFFLPHPLSTSVCLLHHFTTHARPCSVGTSLGCGEEFSSPLFHGGLGPSFTV